MDVLSDVLHSLRLKSSVYCRSELTSPWSLYFTAIHGATFHVIDRGGGWLYAEDQQSLTQLTAGDLIVLPHGCSHQISHLPEESPMVTIRLDEEDAVICHTRRYDYGGTPTTLICGTFDFEQQNGHPLFALLPSLIHIKGENVHERQALNSILQMLASESGSERPGAQTLLRRLADMLFIQVIRLWIEDTSFQSAGWLGALRDPQIGQALSLIHGCPERNWTVNNLAQTVAMSRSAFSAHFTALVGESPIQYLTRWRMQIAAGLLNENQMPLMSVAERVGYESEAAFSKAFKREFGINPGAYRRQAFLSPPQRAP